MYKLSWEQRKEGSIPFGLRMIFEESLHKENWSKKVFVGLVRVHLAEKVKYDSGKTTA